MGFFANIWWTIGFPILALVFLFVGLWLLFSRGQYNGAPSRTRIISGLVCLLLCVVCVGGYFFSASHTVVPVNKRALIINTATAEIVGGIRKPGLTGIPLWTGRVLIFHGGRDEQVCLDFYPATEYAYEVITTVCFYADLGNVDWEDEYLRRAVGYNGILEVWKQELSQSIAVSIKEYPPQDLAEKRGEVTETIEENVRPWFKSNNIKLSRVYFSFWDFTNKEVGDAYDQTVIAQTKKITAQADRDAAEIERETANYRAETANQVLAKRTAALKTAMNLLGIGSEDAVRYLTLQWLENQDAANLRSIILDMSGGDVQPTVPVTP